MKKVIIFLVIIFLVIFFLYAPKITPDEYYHLSDEQRKNTIKKLSKNCLSADILGLLVTYNEVFKDKNATRCWSKYVKKCLIHRENNLTLRLPITCPSY